MSQETNNFLFHWKRRYSGRSSNSISEATMVSETTKGDKGDGDRAGQTQKWTRGGGGGKNTQVPGTGVKVRSPLCKNRHTRFVVPWENSRWDSNLSVGDGLPRETARGSHRQLNLLLPTRLDQQKHQHQLLYTHYWRTEKLFHKKGTLSSPYLRSTT